MNLIALHYVISRLEIMDRFLQPLPAVMIVTVNMKHLVPLDTKHAAKLVKKDRGWKEAEAKLE